MEHFRAGDGDRMNAKIRNRTEDRRVDAGIGSSGKNRGYRSRKWSRGWRISPGLRLRCFLTSLNCKDRRSRSEASIGWRLFLPLVF